MGKRGLSTIVTTILLVLLVLAAIAAIWVAINSFILKGSQSLTLGNIGLDVQINSAFVNTTSGVATVQVTRNKGISNLNVTSLKFIVEDSRNGETFDVPIQNFDEFATRTLEINLSKSKLLDINDIIKISVAPVYISGTTGQSSTSSSTGSIKLEGANQTKLINTKNCQIDSDCGNDTLIDGSKYCSSNTTVSQFKKVYTCVNPTSPDAFCQNNNELLIVETCTGGDSCFAGACKAPTLPCTPENVTQDCGASQFIGIPTCNLQKTSIIQDYEDISCINNLCDSSTTSKTVKDCNSTQVCGEAGGTPECFTPVQCTVNSECIEYGEGLICVKGNCTPEYPVLNGTVSSSWPPGLSELFDSPELPRDASKTSINYIGYTIIFPGSQQKECLQIQDYNYPPSTEYNAYIQLSATKTNITAGDQFQIWETNYGCKLI